MPPQYPETYTPKNGRNDADVLNVALIRSFKFIFIVCIATQQANATTAIAPAGCRSPYYRQNHNWRKSKAKSTKMRLHDILRRDGSKSGLTYFTYLEG